MTPSNGTALSFPVAQRNVYVSDITFDGHVWVWSIDSAGKQVNLKTVDVRGLAEDQARGAVDAQSDELWTELDRVNPLQRDGVTSLPSLSRRHLRLI